MLNPLNVTIMDDNPDYNELFHKHVISARRPDTARYFLYGYQSASAEYHDANSLILHRLVELIGTIDRAECIRDISWRSEVLFEKLWSERMAITGLIGTWEPSELKEYYEPNQGHFPLIHLDMKVLGDSFVFRDSAAELLTVRNGKVMVESKEEDRDNHVYPVDCPNIRFLEYEGAVDCFYEGVVYVHMEKGSRVDVIFRIEPNGDPRYIILHAYRP